MRQVAVLLAALGALAGCTRVIEDDEALGSGETGQTSGTRPDLPAGDPAACASVTIPEPRISNTDAAVTVEPDALFVTASQAFAPPWRVSVRLPLDAILSATEIDAYGEYARCEDACRNYEGTITAAATDVNGCLLVELRAYDVVTAADSIPEDPPRGWFAVPRP